MINKNVFIQNLKDATTVLQQLQICIDEVKTVIDECNKYITIFNEQIALVDEKIASIEYPDNTYGVNIMGTSESSDTLLFWNINVWTYSKEYISYETYLNNSIILNQFKINSITFVKHGSFVPCKITDITTNETGHVITLSLEDLTTSNEYEVEIVTDDVSVVKEFVYK